MENKDKMAVTRARQLARMVIDPDLVVTLPPGRAAEAFQVLEDHTKTALKIAESDAKLCAALKALLDAPPALQPKGVKND